jgi:hypothetical protein
VGRVVADAEAVISVLGPKGRDRGLPVARATATILATMKQHGVHRIVLTATPSSRDPLDRPELKFDVMIQVIKLLMRPAYDEIVGIGEAARASDREWTLVRVPRLTNGQKTGRVRTGYRGQGLGAKLARANMADFIVRQLDDPTWMRKAPMICDGNAH